MPLLSPAGVPLPPLSCEFAVSFSAGTDPLIEAMRLSTHRGAESKEACC